MLIRAVTLTYTMAIASINPATGEKLKQFSSLDDAQIEKRLSRAEEAFKTYRRTTFTERSDLLHAASELLFQEKQKFAEIITLEMGKLFRDSVAEIEKCARGCRFYAENGARFLEEEPAQTDAAESYVEYQPLGPVLAVMPWNFPFWQVFRFAAPALMAGNVAILKHASNVPQCALAIEDIFERAGFPDGVFQTLLIDSNKVARILEDARVAAAPVVGIRDHVVQVAHRRIGLDQQPQSPHVHGAEMKPAEVDRAVVSRSLAERVARVVLQGGQQVAPKKSGLEGAAF